LGGVKHMYPIPEWRMRPKKSPKRLGGIMGNKTTTSPKNVPKKKKFALKQGGGKKRKKRQEKRKSCESKPKEPEKFQPVKPPKVGEVHKGAKRG